jgi:hypothetical protein
MNIKELSCAIATEMEAGKNEISYPLAVQRMKLVPTELLPFDHVMRHIED